jgi:hypothetical protein
MSRSQPACCFRQAPFEPDRLREILRDLARWAAASSIGIATGCSASHHVGPSSQAGAGVGNAGRVNDGGNDGTTTGRGGFGAAGNPGQPLGSGGSSMQPANDGSGGNGVAGKSTGGNGSAGLGVAGKSPPASEWRAADCSQDPLQAFVSMIPERSFDFVAIYRSAAGGTGQVGMFPASSWPVAQGGQSCATATDVTACTAKVTAQSAPSNACMQSGMCSSFLLMTAGDLVTRKDERSALLTLLGGAIDSPNKALIVAIYDGAFDGAGVSCANGDNPGTQTLDTGDGFDVRTQWFTCTGGPYQQTVHVTKDGVVSMGERQMGTATSGNRPFCMTGRRPAGLAAARQRAHRTELGAYFAAAARLEAASVFAFERLAQELSALGADAALVKDAARSALDEIRHAHVMGALAERFGGQLLPVEVAPHAARSAFAIALENAVEGCVRETYGALVALHQAGTALDPEVRRALAVIAEDESRHAQLSWRVAAWLESQLSPDEQRLLAAARQAALAQLLREIDCELSPVACATIGWPAPELAVQLITRLGNALGIA